LHKATVEASFGVSISVYGLLWVDDLTAHTLKSKGLLLQTELEPASFDSTNSASGLLGLKNSWGTIYASLPDRPAGRYDIAYYVDHPSSGYGLARTEMYVGPLQDSSFTITQYPTVSSVSRAAGGYLGGDLLTIRGTGFPNGVEPSVSSVSVSGAPCAILSSTTKAIVCRTGAPADAFARLGELYSSGRGFAASVSRNNSLSYGGRGLLVQIYNDLNPGTLTKLKSTPSFPLSPNLTFVQANGTVGLGVNAGFYYGTRMTGFFVAPYSGLFSFWVKADDQAELRISSSDSPADLPANAQATLPYWSSAYDSFPQQISEPLAMFAGRRYYMELLHSQGHGGDFVKLAVRMFNPPAAIRDVYSPKSWRHVPGIVSVTASTP
jgi:hypothetical protein